MSESELMLERIRQALRRTPNAAGPVSAPDVPSGPLERLRSLGPLPDVMPAIPPHQLVPKFEEELRQLAGRAYRASSLPDLERIVGEILAAANASSAVLSRNPLLASLDMEARLRGWGKSVAVWTAPPASLAASAPSADPDPGVRREAEETFRQRCFSAGVGITGVDFVLAESGSLVLTSLTEGSQLASLAPPVHVALYRRDQVLATLEEVLERLPVAREPDAPAPGRSVVFITGPSRTADIEQILIRGVHGPREVHAILVEDACLEEA